MAGKRPFFLTGANAIVKVNGLTMAFVTDIRYRVQIKHATPRVLGQYEAQEVQPLMYAVSGSFTVIRYAKGFAQIDDGIHAPEGVSVEGNSVGALNAGSGSLIQTSIGDPSDANDGRAHQSLSPFFLNRSMMFDIELRQKAAGFDRTSSENNTGLVAKIRNCRIVDADFSLNKKGLAQQTFVFEAMYADEDGGLAGTSGVGQNLPT